MAKFDLKFIDESFENDFIKVNCVNDIDERSQIIEIVGCCLGDDFCINLDKSTAIKFAKTLRTEINKIQE